MFSKLKDINIDISITKESNEYDKENIILDFNKDFKNILKPGFTIVYLNCNNYSLIKRINKVLKDECRIIIYLSNADDLIKAKKLLNKKNTIILYSNFEINNLKSHVADLVLCENLLGTNGNNILLIKEINRVLKQKGYFMFFESIFLDNPFYSIKTFYKKRMEPKIKLILTNMLKKLKNIKNSEYEINLSGESNFIYSSNDSGSLNDFYNFLININNENRKIILNDIDITIKGTRGI